MAILFKNKIKPQQIRSFKFQKNIFATLAPRYLVIVNVNGDMTYISMPEKEEKEKEKVKEIKKIIKIENGNVTCVCCKKNIIYIGTTTGHITSFDVTTKVALEIHQMKASIFSFKQGPLG